MAVEPLPCTGLRWRCDPESLPFETTADVEPVAGVIGQASAVDSLRFGLECDAPGQNIFIRGLTGTGRRTLVRRLLEEMKPCCGEKHDRCYVHSFAQPDRPRLITLPAGSARAFRRRVHELAEFIREDLTSALDSDALKARRESLEKREKAEIEAITQPFERDLRAASLALVTLQLGPVAHTTIFPVAGGKPVPPEEFEQLRSTGHVNEVEYDAFLERREAFQKRLEEVTQRIREIRRRHARSIHSIVEETARALLGDMAREILKDYPGEDVRHFLSEIVDDVAENRLGSDEGGDPVDVYGVNIVLENEDDRACPIIIENSPTALNLLGTVDREWGPRGTIRSDYRMIRAGSMLRADGGYLILDVRETLVEPGAWRALLRTLKNGTLEIVPPEIAFAPVTAALKPEPVPVKLRVILLGDSYIYYMLDAYDADFNHLFKVLADFDDEIAREPEGLRQYAGVLARVTRDEKLLPFHKSGVAAIVEHGARIAARRGKLTARFGRVADIAREAAFLAKHAGRKSVLGEDVREAVKRTKARADLPSRRFREYLADGTIKLQTRGATVGQINGLAVMTAGPLTYGFPARITATVGAGSAGIINIEGAAQLSGAIHTKGFHILGGLLRHLLQTDHPLAFSASLAFEQSYGGIDGDSASCAEICCLLSALTGVPIRQDLAITGAIDQVGHVEAIGGVNEKIEGFFDTCRDLGFSGTQGVVIPRSNAGDLMLRHDVVTACGTGQFHVYAVETVHEALEILTGVPAGKREPNGLYPEGTLLAQAVDKAREYWLKTLYRPEVVMEEEVEGAGGRRRTSGPPRSRRSRCVCRAQRRGMRPLLCAPPVEGPGVEVPPRTRAPAAGLGARCSHLDRKTAQPSPFRQRRPVPTPLRRRAQRRQMFAPGPQPPSDTAGFRFDNTDRAASLPVPLVMPNSSASEDYLKAIFHLGRDGGKVQTTVLARQLGVSKPSVTSMLKRLKEKGLVDYAPGRGAALTEEGRLATMRVVRRHRLLETFLVEVLGLDWSEVHEEAEVLEHHLSPRMVDAIDGVLGHPSEDPHGHPIPDAEGRIRTRELLPLRSLEAGERATVREVRTAEAGRLQRWKELGLVPGAALVMKQRQDLEDVMHIETGGRAFATGSEGVEGVYVERT